MSLFITFEGLDGAGKTTQIERLRDRLQQLGWHVLHTREPGGTPLGDTLRSLLLDPSQSGMSPEAEALLYAASRAQLVRQVIEPALQSKFQIVLCDRFVDASLAYQGAGLGLGVENVTKVNEFATRGLRPDITFLLDIPVNTSQTRVMETRTQTAPDRIERRSAEYFSRVRGQFLAMAEAEPDRVVLLDAALGVDELEEEIWRHLENRLALTREL